MCIYEKMANGGDSYACIYTQVNEKSFRFKMEEYRDGVKRRGTRPG